MKTSPAGRAKLIEFEGFSAKAYIPVPGDRPTIGHGFTRGVKMGMAMTRAQADARLITELREYEQAVEQACTLEPNQNQFDAMVCLCWNIGIAGFQRSTVLRAHNRGDFQAAARAFGLWNQSSGVVYPGLTRRRAAEAALYLKPVPGVVQRIVEGAIPAAHADELPPEPMPQTVDGERSMGQSSINRAGVVAGGTAAVATVAETVNTVANVKSGVDSLGSWLVPVLLIVVVCLCGYIVWERFGQRKGGWA